MTININGYEPSPVIGHTGDKGKPCLGVFRFSSKVFEPSEALTAFTERKCTHCDRRETYDLNQVTIVAKPGVTRKALEEFCAAILAHLEIERKKQTVKPDHETKEAKILSIVQDATNPSRFAAVMQIEGIGMSSSDMSAYIKYVSAKAAGRFPQKAAYDDIAETTWRKPITYNWKNEIVP